MYFNKLWAARKEVALDAEIFKDLPHYLRHELAQFIMLQTVSLLRVFKFQDLGLKELVAQYLRPVDIAPGNQRGRFHV